jgi:hypothetical protein
MGCVLPAETPTHHWTKSTGEGLRTLWPVPNCPLEDNGSRKDLGALHMMSRRRLLSRRVAGRLQHIEVAVMGKDGIRVIHCLGRGWRPTPCQNKA